MRRLLERIDFPKVFTVLAVTMVVSFGACGLTLALSDRLEALAAIEGLVFVLTAVCLILTIILQVVAVIMGVNKSDTPGTVHLFDHKDNSDDTP